MIRKSSRRNIRNQGYSFRGTTSDLQGLSSGAVFKNFRKAGLPVKPIEAKATAENLKSAALEAAKKLANGESGFFHFETPRGTMPCIIMKKGDKLHINQARLRHNIVKSSAPFEHLMNILKRGFRGDYPPNVVIKDGKRPMPNLSANAYENATVAGDRYTLEMVSPVTDLDKESMHAFVKNADNSQISGVIVKIDSKTPKPKIEEKTRFYQALSEEYGVPFHIKVG
ncbi:MAG: hypothetical protein ABID38_04465 [Candidatus Diapherotrites archaeon]